MRTERALDVTPHILKGVRLVGVLLEDGWSLYPDGTDTDRLDLQHVLFFIQYYNSIGVAQDAMLVVLDGDLSVLPLGLTTGLAVGQPEAALILYHVGTVLTLPVTPQNTGFLQPGLVLVVDVVAFTKDVQGLEPELLGGWFVSLDGVPRGSWAPVSLADLRRVQVLGVPVEGAVSVVPHGLCFDERKQEASS